MRSVQPRFSSASASLIRLNLHSKRENLQYYFRAESRQRCPVFRRTKLAVKMAESTVVKSDSRMCSQSGCNGDDGFGSVSSDYAEIIVVRHGETTWNSDGRLQGHLDVELNEVGRQQAAAVADRLSKEPKISAVYSSDLKRAFVTAQTIANSCGVLEVIQDPDLRERNLGDLQGLVLREAATLKPEAYQAFVSGKADKDIPGGGESLDQLYQRCTSSLQKIGRKHKGERVVVVTHGGVLRALYRRAAPKGKPQGKILNTSVNIFHLSDGGEDWVIKVWGDVSHLSETGFLKTAFGGDRTSELSMETKSPNRYSPSRSKSLVELMLSNQSAGRSGSVGAAD
ncbi:Histidine phosphatase superfamily [Macleaya cordata]|uniref:Histidine phosphatase superfamily n=1 Tax=Macleaya cordata TaxID=56857 RepID=A0A200PNL9_MACCD|nr:Histidine phosphatase superfamily [Macleaya cordata]